MNILGLTRQHKNCVKIRPKIDIEIKSPGRFQFCASLTYIQLHIFSDASEWTISAVQYLRGIDTCDQVQVGFLCGKSKVALQHGHTIPRLELCAAQLAVELADTVVEQLDMKEEQVYYYTESKVVLGYLYNEQRRFYIYVANRVARIRQSSSHTQWHFLPTDENPADQGTRPVPADQMAGNVRLNGPYFLRLAVRRHLT